METQTVYASQSTVFHYAINTHGKHEIYQSTDNNVGNTVLE